MAGSGNKTAETSVDPVAWIAALDPTRRAEEGAQLCALFERVSGVPARMWGPSIVGFGAYRYRYESGREGESCRIGFSPRAGKHVLYLRCDGNAGAGEALLARLGKHKSNGGCIYVNKLSDIDLGVLEEIVRLSWATMAERYPD